MRNAKFLMAVAAALSVGGLIGWSIDVDRVQTIAMLAAGADDPSADAGTSSPLDPAEGHEAVDLARLDFAIDTTETRSSSNGSGPRAAADTLQTTDTCRLPRASSGAQIVLFGTYEGDAVSTVALADRDMETTVVEIIIERGEPPLHIILSSFSNVVWRFSGAVDRVDQVVLMASPTFPPREIVPSDARTDFATAGGRGYRPPPRSGRKIYAGVVGLDAEQVRTVSPDGCFDYFHEVGSIKAVQIAATVRRAMGRPVDVVAGQYSLAALRLPSGFAAKASDDRRAPPKGFDARLWHAGLQFYPGGITRLDETKVVSSVPALSYDVLPSQIGLSQLVGSGALKPLPDGLKIVRPIPRFPAQLNGAHSTAFLLGTGIPMPAGDPGHSCVIDESTGRPVTPNSITCR